MHGWTNFAILRTPHEDGFASNPLVPKMGGPTKIIFQFLDNGRGKTLENKPTQGSRFCLKPSRSRVGGSDEN
jgi:hypothetical protein